MRRRTVRWALVAFGLAALVASVSCLRGERVPEWGPTSKQLKRGTLGDRTYAYFVPEGHGPFPLLVALHGRGGDGESQEKLTGISRIAAREHFVVVYPDGYDKSWHDARDIGPAAEAGVNDVAFVSALIDRFVAEHEIDPTRVYAAGMSNGAMMALTLACRISHKLAGVAAVTGLLATKETCATEKPISVALILGDADPLVPYGGGAVAKNRGVVRSGVDTFALFGKAAGCTSEEPARDLPDTDPNDGTRTRVRTLGHCSGDAEVRLYTVEGGGHTWPGGWQYLGKSFVGVTARDFSASEELWAFLSPHRRP
ncbi:MAG: extracellular catalytic domain type 1 short-chain-length polyhydroxyalkanoate depolymerase [Polyangiales bacterium]